MREQRLEDTAKLRELVSVNCMEKQMKENINK